LDAANRSDLRFEELAHSIFDSALAAYGLFPTETGPSLVRFESATRFVILVHDRLSYQVELEVGRWMRVNGETMQQAFPIQTLLYSRGKIAGWNKGFAGMTSQAIEGELTRDLERLRQFGEQLFTDDEEAFDQLERASIEMSRAYNDRSEAATLRAAADAAWHRGDFETVASTYATLRDFLPTVQLRRSEVGRLKYASERIASTEPTRWRARMRRVGPPAPGRTATVPISASPNRLLATVIGAIYVVIGVLGFTVTNGGGFFATHGSLLLGVFEVNPFHNVAHVVIGAALLMAGLSSLRAAKTVNTIVGTFYLLLGIVGLFLVGTDLNVLALNVPDHVLHFASAVMLLGVGLGADQEVSAK
jgi:hypothetical protein